MQAWMRLVVICMCLFTSISLFPDVDMQAYGWVPVVVICVFISLFRAGLGPIPWFMMAEVLPMECKSWATSVVVCFTWICTFFVTKLFVIIVDTIGFTYTYLVMSSVATVGLFFIIYCVPETKDKSSEEIRFIISGECKGGYGLLSTQNIFLVTQIQGKR